MDWESFQDRLKKIGEDAGDFLKGLFGSRNERVVKQLEPLIRQINELESWAKSLSAEQFQEQTAKWKKEVQSGERTLDDILPHAFALVREASVRTLGLRHFDVQLVGGMILHKGAIAEMMTGEGKTLVATLPLYLNCLEGKPVYLVTVNDYLARRDAAWMGPIYDYLGVAVAAIQSDMTPWERLPVYSCDIVYGTNSEFGFDYLRDNMKNRVEDQVQRVLHFAIVDEVDSILIDEARTPLIIAGPASDTSDKYRAADMVAQKLTRDVHFEVKEKERTANLLEAGIEEAEKILGIPSFYQPPHEDWPHFIENALRAHYLYTRDKEYVVDGDEVVIVDEFTGRKMQGRRWSDGLHQAVETREGLKPREENQTLATITYQNYFRMFKKLAGMTGTAVTEAGEFLKIYKLDVLTVPTNLPIARLDANDVVYRTEPEKWKAIVDEIARVHEKGQPVLVGTTSIEKSEKLAQLLNERKIPHEVLNAKNHEREAGIIARAGEKGAVTVATNMAGRGTDIKLGGNFEHRLAKALEEKGLVQGDMEHAAEIETIRDAVKKQCAKDEAEVQALGGLYVLGTERHEARRIDNQLRGRSGRQGNAGESRFYLSLQDDLMRRFYKEWLTNAMKRLGMEEGVPIEAGMVTRAIARAQKKVEDYHFEIRKNLLEYDEVMDSQRKEIYTARQQVLENRGLKEMVATMLTSAVNRAATKTFLEDAEGLRGWYQRMFGLELDKQLAFDATRKGGNAEELVKKVLARYDEREKELGSDGLRQIERYLLLNTIDTRWKDHLRAIDALRQGIGLRGYAQVDPKNEYKREGFLLFEKLKTAIEEEVGGLILRIEIRRDPPPQAARPAPAAAPAPVPTAGGSLGGLLRPPAAAAPARPPASPATGPADAAAAPTNSAPSAPPPAAAAPSAPAAAASPAAPAPAPKPAAASPVPPPSPTPPAARSGGAPATAAAQPPAPPARRVPMQPSIPASHAFDLHRRQQALQAQRQAAEAARQAPAKPSASAADSAEGGVGRNDLCPCGSGQKYKKCHGKES
ncbi:MAG: preprotein translocase subunit SecA [Planctomycetota bacterium]